MWLFCIICYLKPFLNSSRNSIAILYHKKKNSHPEHHYANQSDKSEHMYTKEGQVKICVYVVSNRGGASFAQTFSSEILLALISHLLMMMHGGISQWEIWNVREWACETLLVHHLPIHESIIDFSSSKEEPLDSQQEEVLELLLFQSSNDDDSSGGNNEPTAGSNNHKETNSIYAAVEEGNNKTRADVDRIISA